MVWQKESKGIIYRLKMFWQYLTRGFSDYEVYTFERHFIEWIVPRLERTLEKKKQIGYELPVKEWDEMISGFKIYLDDSKCDKCTRPGTEEYEALHRSMRLLTKWFGCLSY